MTNIIRNKISIYGVDAVKAASLIIRDFDRDEPFIDFGMLIPAERSEREAAWGAVPTGDFTILDSENIVEIEFDTIDDIPVEIIRKLKGKIEDDSLDASVSWSIDPESLDNEEIKERFDAVSEDGFDIVGDVAYLA